MKYLAVAFAYLCLFCLGFLDNARGPLYPYLLDYLAISPGIGSLFFSVSALAAFLMAIGSGKLIKTFSLLRLGQVGLLFFALSALILGQLPSGRLGLILLVTSSFLLGLGVGIHSITVNLITNQHTSQNFRRRVFAGLHSMYGMASFLAPMAMSMASGYGVSWKQFFLCVGVSYLGLFFISFLFLSKVREKKTPMLTQATKVIKPIWPMGLMFSCYMCSEVIFSSRLVFYLSSVHGQDNAGVYLSWFFALLLIGRLGFAFLPLPFSSLNLLKLSAGSALIVTTIGISLWPQILPIVGLCMSYFFPCAMDLVAGYFELDELDQALAKVMIIVGGALVFFHVAFGQISNFLGANYSIWMIPLLLVIVLYILHTLSRDLASRVSTVKLSS